MKYFAAFFLLFCWGVECAAQDSLQRLPAYQNALIAYQKAEYAQAESLFRQASKTATRPEMQETCLLQAVQCLLKQGRLAEAGEQMEALPAENTSCAALRANTTGELYLHLGRNDLALKAFERALQRADPQSLEKSRAYAYIGIVYWNTGNQEVAVEYLQKALTLRLANLPAAHPEIAACYNDLGLVYSEVEPLQAREFYEKALAIYVQTYGEQHPKTAIAYTNIAITYKKEQNLAEALQQMDKAAHIWEGVYGMQHPNTAFAYTNLGQTHLELGHTMLAENFLKQARDIYEKNFGRKHPEIANSYNLLGNFYKAQGNIDLALQQYQRAICANIPDFEEQSPYQNPAGETAYNPDILLYSLLTKAELLEERHFAKSASMRDLNTALQTLELCDKWLDRIRRTRQTKNDKIALNQTATLVYEYGIKICLELREINFNKRFYSEKAFYFAEKSKSAVLLSAIADTEAKEYAGIPAPLLSRETHIKRNISRLEQKIAQNPDAGKELQDSLFAAKRAYEGFIKELEAGYPDYYNLKYNNQIADVGKLQASLGEGELMLMYFIAEKHKRLFIFAISRKSLEVWDIPKHEDLDKYIVSLRNGIKFRSAKNFVRAAYFLFEQLGLRKLPHGKETLIIVPDGRVGTIPFEALLTAETSPATGYAYMPYLCKQKNIGYAFSATLFAQNQQKRNETQNSVALCAPVDFSVHQQTDLEGTEQEVLRLREFFQGEGFAVQCFLRKEAERGLFAQLKQPKILHLATHGAVNEDNPEFSEILLAGKTLEEAHLYSSDIYNLRLPVDLVALSACETGLGKVYRGEGIVGLTRALFYAGARNIAVSLWTVSDASTVELMTKFYKYSIKEKLAYSAALRRAKLDLLMHEAYAAPYYWAAFVLMGK